MTIKINGTNTTAQPSITGADTDTGLVYGTDEVQVVTGGTTRATVDSAGNLGVGTSSPSGLIHTVQASGASRIRFEASNSHSFTRLIAGSTSYNASVELFSGSTNTANITGLGAGGLQFEVGGSERMRIDSSGNVILGFAGNNLFFKNAFNNSESRIQCNAGSNSSNFRFLVKDSGSESETVRFQSSGGISFNGDTAAANALDDYEEGTWTPVLRFGTGNTGMTFLHSPSGTYTKIGNTVRIRFGFRLSAKGSSTGSIIIEGLPFSGPQSSYNHSGGALLVVDAASDKTAMALLTGNTNLQFRTRTDTNISTTNTYFSNNTAVFGTFVYDT